MGRLLQILTLLLIPFNQICALKSLNSQVNANLVNCLRAIGNQRKGIFSNGNQISIEADSRQIRYYFLDTIDQFLANGSFPVHIHSSESVGSNILVRLIFVDSLDAFKRSFDNQHHLKFNFVIFPPNMSIGQMRHLLRDLFAFCYDFAILNINVIVKDVDEAISLYTYYPLNDNGCSDNTPRIQNRFINGSFKWTKLFFPNKMSNFWQCPVRAVTWNDPPFLFVNDQLNQISGWNVDLINIISKSMNFSIVFVNSGEGIGHAISRSNMTGAFRLIRDRQGDLIIGNTLCDPLRFVLFDPTPPYHTFQCFCVIRWATSYWPLEMLLLPFDSFTWISLFIILFVRRIFIIVWQRYKKTSLPFGQHSKRLCVAGLALSILLLRSCYEGLIFRYLNNWPIKQMPKSMQDAADDGFKFLVQTSNYEILIAAEVGFASSLIPMNVSSDELYKVFNSYEGKYGILLSQDYISIYANETSTYEHLFIIPKKAFALKSCMYMTKYSFLAKSFDLRVVQLSESGVIKKIYNNNFIKDNVKRKNAGRAYKVYSLPLGHFDGLFQLCAFLISVCFCLFTVELLSVRYRMLKVAVDFFH